jgi:hypothetical protein
VLLGLRIVWAGLENELLERVAQISNASKALAGGAGWRPVRNRTPTAIELVNPISIEGAVHSGLQARLTARSDMPDSDVYAQLEVWCPEIEKYLHFDRAEWRPIRPHTNPPNSPSGLRGLCLQDRMLPFSLNRRLGINALLQTVTLMGQPLPEDLTTFKRFTEFLGIMWHLEGASVLPEPPWQERLL